MNVLKQWIVTQPAEIELADPPFTKGEIRVVHMEGDRIKFLFGPVDDSSPGVVVDFPKRAARQLGDAIERAIGLPVGHCVRMRSVFRNVEGN